MAMLLYRLGRWCAEHAWRVIAAWIAVLVALGAGAATLGSPLTSQVTVPGSDFQRVLDDLGHKIPQASGGFGTVVFESETAGAFTPAQRAAIEEVMASWRTIPHVKAVMDPFANQAQIDKSATQLSTAAKELTQGKSDLAAAWTRISEGQGQVDMGNAWIAWFEKNAPTHPQLAAIRSQVATGTAQLADAKAQYAAGQAKLKAGEEQYAAGTALRAATDGMRFVSEDGRAAIAQVQFDDNVHSIPVDVRDQIPAHAAALAAAGVHADYSVEITQNTSLVGPGEVVGLAVAMFVLVLMLGTLIAAGLPLAVALVGVGVGLAAAMAATFAFQMNTMTPSLALMLGLAVGIDYALFIVNRHRGQLLAGTDLVESIGRAVGTAGNAVLFAGSTVVIALAALVVSGIPILAQMGLVAAATVALTVAVALTLSPAILRLMGRRILSRRAWAKSRTSVSGAAAGAASGAQPAEIVEEEHGSWYVQLMTRRPWLTILGVVAVVGIIAAPAASLRLGLPDGSSEPADSTAYATYQQVEKHFGPGMNGPILAVANLERPVAADQVTAKQADIATALAKVGGVRSVVPFGVSPERDTLAFQIVPTTGPADAATVTTVRDLQGSVDAIGTSAGASIGLTGQTVANIEVSQRLAAALPLYLAVVVGLSLVILMVVFRSLVVPLVATGGFLLSVAAAFGATVAVYQWGWLGSVFQVSQPGAILSFMPIILIGVLFGLAMDYQMFLVSGMHEAHAHGESAHSAVRTGFTHGAKVVTAAAVIMFSVFGGFVFSHLSMVRPIGFGLAVGVIVDAVLVRMTLTPAIMHLLGERAWWMPKWLGRVTPDLDVEGTELSAHLSPAH
jgi:RND superfamily putative drug exporter